MAHEDSTGSPAGPPREPPAFAELLPLVQRELRALAAHYLRSQPPGHTLQPTALVNEAFVRLSRGETAWASRDHFLAVAAKAMRHVLVDHARSKNSEKRGGDRTRIDLGAVAEGSLARAADLPVIELDDLLSRLGRADARSAEVAEMILFGGMEQEQIAQAIGVSRATVSADWRFARAWLASRVLGGGGGPTPPTAEPCTDSPRERGGNA